MSISDSVMVSDHSSTSAYDYDKSSLSVIDFVMISNESSTAADDNNRSSMSAIDFAIISNDSGLNHDDYATENYFDTATSDDVYNDIYYLTFYDFEIITLGLVRTIIVLFMILANVFVVGYFLSSKGRGKSTNLLFVSIAFSDSMTGISLLPNSFNVYIPDIERLSASGCNTYMVLQLYISKAFHTASIWQTVFLGIQRYLCVCYPFISGRICTFWKTCIAVLVMYLLSFLMHIYQLINATTHKYTQQLECQWRTDQPCKDACLYMWICVIFMHFLPASLLIGLTTKTLITLQKAQRRASSIISKSTNKKRSSRDRIITITAVLIVICFLVPEVPYGLYKLYALIDIYRPTSVKLGIETHHIMFSVYEIALIVSFHANFWIYCTMMCDFRRSVINVFTLGCFKRYNFKRRQSLNSYQGTMKSDSFRSSKARTGSVTSRNTVLSRTTSLHSTTSDNIHAVNQIILLTPTPTKDTGPPDFSAYVSTQKSKEEYDAQDDDVFV
ncbi:sex peptide receptor-like [Dreissena polymorpha]|uniref:sex peptide receptor-like n=1 Tax=Dreissena polymorpha TaxID=45954 RepID=UPI0022647228|nr:sex peptide receptor-like [Dreissena polymorpha]